ncbi:Choline binding ABC transport system ATP-binding protein ChoV [hydrothermal vent metagenome]|uniref:Choline binding ABC transport system ATP-binding protein ChoV n=1 Tax=hydrothermal vent metagenome TaxID=652676 RepID=A0A3B0R691_9ZZZZ
MPALDFRNVDIIFGDKSQTPQALKMLDAGSTRSEILEKTGAVLGVADASISVETSEVCVLMGLSGSGKSTLLRAVNGLNQVTRGSVLLGGGDTIIDVASCKPDVLRKLRMERVAMVFQQFALLPWRTVAENVGLGLELRGLPAGEIKAQVDEKLELVQLSQWRDKQISQLSGGMQQRVGLARAFATDADILLMDEPFSALDPLIRNHLQDELLDLQKSLKKTIVFVSHDLDEALKIGSHIAIMEEGRIVQYGTPQDIILNPANDYVARFVAHMNPLNVMQASSLMTPVKKLKSENGIYLLDASERWKLELKANGTVKSLLESGKDVSPVLRSPDTGMRDIIKQRHQTGCPVLLEDNGKVIGIIGDDEIYRGILSHGNG